MSSSRSQLNQTLAAFAGELRTFAQKLSENVTAIKKTVEMKPHAGGKSLALLSSCTALQGGAWRCCACADALRSPNCSSRL